MNRSVIRINPADNVAVALMPLSAGDRISAGGISVTLLSDIPSGHKIALTAMSAGSDVIKYGYPIGHVTCDISPGSLIDERNLATNLSGLNDYTYNPVTHPGLPSQIAQMTFKGYRRADGRAATRNEIWIIPTVGCVNATAETLARMLADETGLKGLDAVVPLTHNYGCSQLGDDFENTRLILRDMVLHPNAGGVLIVGLGCENNQLSEFIRLLGDYDTTRIKFIETQKVSDEITAGMDLLRDIYSVVSAERRVDIPLSELVIGLKCGGSDGLSGITANPLLGLLTDFIVAQGGSAVMTEVPEMFGAETILMNRCRNRALFDQTVGLINGFKDYFIRAGQEIYENPSPGNKRGGISTLEEKSLGCVQKSGSVPVSGVLSYGERVTEKGLNLLYGPGNDLVASTALAAAGCQLILFTTGRGTPLGTVVPTIKVSTNTPLAIAKPRWIDFDAGTIATGENASETLARLVKLVIGVASGQPVCAENAGFRQMAIFKTGVTL